MKLKKIKYSFISTLTLIISSFAIVSCVNKWKTYDKNYLNMINFFNNTLNNNGQQNNFIKYDSSFLNLIKNFDPDFTYTINNKIDPNNTYIFDDKNKIKLSDLEYGGISIDINNVIKFNDGINTIKLDKNTFFASNFDFKLRYKNKDKNKLLKTDTFTYNNLTSFFQLDNNKKNNKIDLKLTPYNTNTKLEAKNLFDFDPNSRDNVGFENNFYSDPKLGIDSKDSNKNILWYGNFPTLKPGDLFRWYPNDTANSLNNYIVDFNQPISYEDNKINFIYNSVLIHDVISTGEFSGEVYDADFYVLADLKRLDEGTFNFSIKDPFIVYFSKMIGTLI